MPILVSPKGIKVRVSDSQVEYLSSDGYVPFVEDAEPEGEPVVEVDPEPTPEPEPVEDEGEKSEPVVEAEPEVDPEPEAPVKRGPGRPRKTN